MTGDVSPEHRSIYLLLPSFTEAASCIQTHTQSCLPKICFFSVFQPEQLIFVEMREDRRKIKTLFSSSAVFFCGFESGLARGARLLG